MEKFIPDMYQKSIFTINYKKLRDLGIKCLLFDVDNTIVPIDEKKPNTKIINLFDELKDMGFKIILFSNAHKKRLEPFKTGLNVDCCALASKPRSKNYLKIINMFDLEVPEVAAIGDQMVTDIYGGNKVGITTILVNQIGIHDLPITYFNRLLERFIMKKLAKNGLFNKGKYYE